jgi:hypothetical protein
MAKEIYINVHTNLKLTFGLDWNCSFLPRVGESISFEALLKKTDVTEIQKIDILCKNIFIVTDIFWIGDDEIQMSVDKNGESFSFDPSSPN